MNWYPVEWSARLKNDPVAVVLQENPIVLFRSNGKISALVDRCPHRGAPLSKGYVNDGKIVCPYHGWTFQNDGACTNIPGLENYACKKIHSVSAYKVEERYGLVWVCLDQQSLTAIPEITAYEKAFHQTMEVKSAVKDVVENALDPLHTHFVHGKLIRADMKRQPIVIKMTLGASKIEAEYCNEVKQQGWGYKMISFGRQVEKSFGRYYHPSVFQLEFVTTKNETLIVNGFLCPISKQVTKVFVITSTNAPIPNFIFKGLIRPLFKLALTQDKEILEIRSKHLEKYGIGTEVSTQGDLFGPYLDLLSQGKNLASKEYEVKLYV